MTMKNRVVIWSVSIVLLTACIVCACCTSQQVHTSAQSKTPAATTPSQTLSPATIAETRITTPAQTTAPAATIPMAGPAKKDVLTVTLNSAEKKVSYGNYIGKPGRIGLILDITIRNNDKQNDFAYSDSSFILAYKSYDESQTAITSQYAKVLGNPLFMGTIPAGSTDDGKILFGVNASSTTYRLSVVDSTGAELGSIDTIFVP
jgi:Domain of unknown function (DUF4352)